MQRKTNQKFGRHLLHKNKHVFFPYAGGATFYAKWIQYFDKQLVVCPIQLPGREERIGEASYLNMQSLVKDVVDIIMRYDNDYVLFGHSMGGKIAFKVEKNLRAIIESQS